MSERADAVPEVNYRARRLVEFAADWGDTMNRGLSWLLGPELFWLLTFGLTVGLTRLNVPPTETGNAWLERLAWILPLVAIPGAFVWSFGFAAPGQSRGWLAVRLTLATLVGLNVCLFQIAGSIDYKDTRNAGLLGVWVIGLLAGLVAFAGSAIVQAVMVWKDRPS